MAEAPEQQGSTEGFLRDLANDLLQIEGVDVDVVAVLQEHVLVANPGEQAVVHAHDAIVRLARQRASRPDDGRS